VFGQNFLLRSIKFYRPTSYGLAFSLTPSRVRLRLPSHQPFRHTSPLAIFNTAFSLDCNPPSPGPPFVSIFMRPDFSAVYSCRCPIPFDIVQPSLPPTWSKGKFFLYELHTALSVSVPSHSSMHRSAFLGLPLSLLGFPDLTRSLHTHPALSCAAPFLLES